MEIISHFSLEKHQGAYGTWPLKSKLFYDKKDTAVQITGYSLRYQFKLKNKLKDEFLLITDWDCPFEEVTELWLLNSSFKIISHKSIGAWHSSWLLDDIKYVGPNQFLLLFGDLSYNLTIRPGLFPWFF